ncbi:lipase family alpha/beta hydrolase [Antrihabitans stalactiti]|uniref:Alpha/beta fold hydrolase n=1 Tax=Antrihabitans stalactiti TaxID=2584121 RepID=A0A848KSH6_9NOCA|nr:alpha/beta fold hydrolase [Antrihabitans stalactiti]NMN99200.1 alpha/beta fold hydrolase [Antrihabitans stalactiti]
MEDVRPTMRAKIACLTCACALLLGPVAAKAEPQASPVGPAQSNWWSAYAYSLSNPTAIPIGLNDFGCVPSAAHPRPVVLVNGFLESVYVNWSLFGPQLKAAGYCVFGLNYGEVEGLPIHQIGPMRDSAAEIGAFVDHVLAATGAQEVDIVGHSEGGLVSLYYLNRLDGSDRVGTWVGIAPTTNGASAYGLLTWIAANPPIAQGIGTFAPSMGDGTAGSKFVEEASLGGWTRTGVGYTTIASRYDLAVQVAESQLPAGPNVSNIVLQDVCPTDLADHTTIVYDENVLQLVRNALDPANSLPVKCNSVVPLIHQSPLAAATPR